MTTQLLGYADSIHGPLVQNLAVLFPTIFYEYVLFTFQACAFSNINVLRKNEYVQLHCPMAHTMIHMSNYFNVKNCNGEGEEC